MENFGKKTSENSKKPADFYDEEVSLETDESVDFPNVEEVEKSFLAKKAIFEELRKHSTNQTEIATAEQIIQLFENSHESDANLAKRNKENYLKHLNLAIERIRESFVNDSEIAENSEEYEEKVNEVGIAANSESEIVEEEVGSEEKTDYQVARAELLQTKKDYQVKKEAYDQALDNYYKEEANASVLQKTKKFFGLQPEFPEELKRLEKDYKEVRGAYANNLNKALVERNKVTYESYSNEKGESVIPVTPLSNKSYDINSDSVKVSYANKFILKPNKQLLERQEAILLTEAQKSQLNRILSLMSKNKWAFRAGIVTIAGLGAAAGGGVAAFALGAGWQAAKIATGTLVGSAAAEGVSQYKQKDVDRAGKLVDEVSENAKREFSIEGLDGLEEELIKAQKNKDESIKAQKKASMAAAFATGGIFSAGWHLGLDPDVITNSPDKLSGNSDKISAEVNSAWNKNPEELADLIGGEPAKVINQTEVDSAENITPSIEIPMQEKVSLTSYDNYGNEARIVHLNDIKLLSTNSKLEDLDTFQSQKEAVKKAIFFASNDMLAAHPNIANTALENFVFEKLQKQFGDASWWNDAKLTGVNFGDVSVEIPEKNANPEIPVVENNNEDNVSVTAVDEVPHKVNIEKLEASQEVGESVKYTVERNDTLWDITEKVYKDELKGLTESEKNKIIGSLMEKARTDNALLETLNLRSGDIELIYPKEVIDLGPLGDELKKLIELQKNSELTDYSKKVHLAIENTDPVKKIPINFQGSGVANVDSYEIETPKAVSEVNDTPFHHKVELESVKSYTPLNFAKQQIIDVFGTEKRYEIAFNNLISDIEKDTYDMFTRGLFNSPYSLMKSMTLNEIKEFDNLDTREIREQLDENNIKYETYLAWLQKIRDIQHSGLSYNSETKLSDLLTRHVIDQASWQMSSKK